MRSGKKRNRKLSSSVDCCYSNLPDLLRVKTRVFSYNLYGTPFLSFPSHLTLVKFIKLKRTQRYYFLKKKNSLQKIKIKNTKNDPLEGHGVGVPC
jgi:hypothetical protein